MNNRLRDFADLIFAYLIIIPVFWLVVKYSALYEYVKELYYRVFNIPYYKGNGKFHYYVKRTDK